MEIGPVKVGGMWIGCVEMDAMEIDFCRWYRYR
jgi:hypothetical protein